MNLGRNGPVTLIYTPQYLRAKQGMLVKERSDSPGMQETYGWPAS